MAEERRGEPKSKAGIARKGTGPGAASAKPLPEPYWMERARKAAKGGWPRPGRIKLKRKTNRGASRKSGR